MQPETELLLWTVNNILVLKTVAVVLLVTEQEHHRFFVHDMQIFLASYFW